LSLWMDRDHTRGLTSTRVRHKITDLEVAHLHETRGGQYLRVERLRLPQARWRASDGDVMRAQAVEVALQLCPLLGKRRQLGFTHRHFRLPVNHASVTLVPALTHGAGAALLHHREAVLAHPPAPASERPVVGAADGARTTLGVIRGA